jgi:hypothetical protein
MDESDKKAFKSIISDIFRAKKIEMEPSFKIKDGVL